MSRGRLPGVGGFGYAARMSQVEHESQGRMVRCSEALSRPHAGGMFVTAPLIRGISSGCRTVPFPLGFGETPAPKASWPVRVLCSLICIVDDLPETIGYSRTMFAIGRPIADAITRRAHTE